MQHKKKVRQERVACRQDQILRLLPPRSFHSATCSNVSGPSYANQSGLPNMEICFDFEKSAIRLLSSSAF